MAGGSTWHGCMDEALCEQDKHTRCKYLCIWWISDISYDVTTRKTSHRRSLKIGWHAAPSEHEQIHALRGAPTRRINQSTVLQYSMQPRVFPEYEWLSAL